MREDEARDALHLLGLPHGYTWFLGHLDSEMPSVGPMFQFAARRVAGICETHGCNLIIANWRHDPHPDHVAAATLAEHVAVREELPLLSYPIGGWGLPDTMNVDEPQPRGYRLDISGEVDLKRKAIMTHATQYGDVIRDCKIHNAAIVDRIIAAALRPVEIYLAS
jgi:LmbE family N-acetylglucosaminyl deacetylase